MKRFAVLMVTCASSKEARSISEALVGKRLAACVNIISGVNSVFRWKGKIENAEEFLLLVKARRTDFKKIETAVKKIHSYTVPEIIAMPVVAGSKDYLDWVEKETRR